MRAGDIAIVTNLIDKFLNKEIEGKKTYDRDQGKLVNLGAQPVIVDDGRLPNDHVMMKGSMSDTALLLKGIKGNDNSAAYWMEYGRRIYEKFENDEPMGIRCDSCTALAFFLLRTNGCTGRISVIEQAQGNANGHWFLLVGCDTAEEITYPKEFPRGSFAVDLWGVGVKRQRGENQSITSALSPAFCVYSCGNNALTVKVTCDGAETIPSLKAFKAATHVTGWFGDKWRSGKLSTLDGKIKKYHKGEATAQEVQTALDAWIAKKDEKYKNSGGATQSIRITQALCDDMSARLNWVKG